jgi:hypothetical protein
MLPSAIYNKATRRRQHNLKTYCYCVVLRKSLHLKARKLSIVQGERCMQAFKCKRLRNNHHTVIFGIPL